MVVNCLPFLGLESKVRVMGGFFHDDLRQVGEGARVRPLRPRAGPGCSRRRPRPSGRGREKMAPDVPRRGKGCAAGHGEPCEIRLRDQGGGRERGRGWRDGQAGGDEALRHRQRIAPEGMCRLYREGGAEALRPRPKGRPRKAPGAPATREEEPEREVRRLEAQVAYLNKTIALKVELGLPLGSGRRP